MEKRDNLETEVIDLQRVIENSNNPRFITGSKLEKLIESILVFPKMLQIRPVVVDSSLIVLGGNMRRKALDEISKMSFDQIKERLSDDRTFEKKTKSEKEEILKHWKRWVEKPTLTIVRASDLSEEEQKEFIIKDNVLSGDWSEDVLDSEYWKHSSVDDWGIEIFEDLSLEDEQPRDLEKGSSNKPFVVKITFQKQSDIDRFMSEYGNDITDKYNCLMSVSGGEL